METNTDSYNKEISSATDKIIKAFPDPRELCDLMATALGAAKYIGELYMEDCLKDPIKVNTALAYWIIQTNQLLSCLREVVTKENPSTYILKYNISKTYNDLNDPDCEKRLIFLVKEFYNHFKGSGKI